MTQIELLNKTVERLQAENADLRKKRMSAVCRAKAYQRHWAGAQKAALNARADADYWMKESDKWQGDYMAQRMAFKNETAAHIKTLRERDLWKQEASKQLVKVGKYLSMVQQEIKRGDFWQIASLMLGAIVVGLIGGVWWGR